MEETIIEKPTSHPGTNRPNEIQIGDQREVSTSICMDEAYRMLLSISQAMFTKKQFQYLIETMQLYHFTEEQWNNLKAILIDNEGGFTDDQWKTKLIGSWGRRSMAMAGEVTRHGRAHPYSWSITIVSLRSKESEG